MYLNAYSAPTMAVKTTTAGLNPGKGLFHKFKKSGWRRQASCPLKFIFMLKMRKKVRIECRKIAKESISTSERACRFFPPSSKILPLNCSNQRFCQYYIELSLAATVNLTLTITDETREVVRHQIQFLQCEGAYTLLLLR